MPLVRFSSSAANIRHSRSRKSPSAIVPPGNWWEILNICAATAVPKRDAAIVAGAANAAARTWRRLTIMVILPDSRPVNGVVAAPGSYARFGEVTEFWDHV